MDLTLLTEQQTQDALEHGWKVCHVYDMASKSMLVEAVVMSPTTYSSRKALFDVIWSQARSGDATCIAALQAIKRFPPMKVTP